VVVEPIAGPVVSVLVAIGSAAPLAWRRTAPTAAALAGTAIWMVPTPHGFLFAGFVIAVLLFFSVGAHVQQTWRVVAVTAFGVCVGVVMTILGPEDPAAAPGAALAVAAPAVAGRLVARYRLQNARLRELSEELVRERARSEQAAVAEERTRIARELHDVIGHEVTVIALQADAAAAALTQAPDRAAAPIVAIRAAAAQALDEMRRVVHLLRRPGDDRELHPQPGLSDLCALVEATRAAGTPVDLALRLPDLPPLPSVQLAAYRLVQEALTNSRRHAPGSAVRVRVDATDGHLCVEVLTSGGRPARNPGSGHGIVGMRERVRMHGGQLDVGPTLDGYAVRARLPLVLPAAP
jgi:signal transduction histidine kinase